MFADDIALLANKIAQSQELLSRVETEAAKIGLHCNAKKTELMVFNHEDDINIVTLDWSRFKTVENFKYFEGWMN